MAQALVEFQKFVPVKVTNQTFGIHKVRLLTSADHVVVPRLADPFPSNSIARLDDGSNPTVASFYASSPNRVDLDGGVAGGIVWFVARHSGRLNFAPEA